MKLLNKRISRISKSVLLYSLLIGGSYAGVISSDRFLVKILDRTISFQDIEYQLRNLKGLKCIYDDSLVIQYFETKFVKNLESFVKNFPKEEPLVKKYLHENEDTLRDIRYFFKMLRYSEDQKNDVNKKLESIIRESAKENNCNSEVLYKDTLKTNFKSLLEMELYLRSRYSAQIKTTGKFESVRPSISLFVESLDKQFAHEYYW